LFSSLRVGFKHVQIKKPPFLAVFQDFGWALLFVMLLREPSAFHRLGAGVAKVKIKEKAHESHGF
jgi:hypothetical protein